MKIVLVPMEMGRSHSGWLGQTLHRAIMQGEPIAIASRENIDALVAAARSGDPMASAKLAMRVHISPDETRPFGANAQYSQLLANCYQSDDPEFLVAVGEELSKGKLLAGDGRSAARFHEKADRRSPFMGAYMMARVVAGRNPVLTKRFLDKAIAAGHATSLLFRQNLRLRRLRWARQFVRPFYALRAGFTIAYAIKHAPPESLRMKYWRYKDVVPLGFQDLDAVMGDDRIRYFEEERAALNPNP